jgi:hypothetical protein
LHVQVTPSHHAILAGGALAVLLKDDLVAGEQRRVEGDSELIAVKAAAGECGPSVGLLAAIDEVISGLAETVADRLLGARVDPA